MTFWILKSKGKKKKMSGIVQKLYLIIIVLFCLICCQNCVTHKIIVDSDKVYFIHNGKAERTENGKIVETIEPPYIQLEDWVIISKGNFLKLYIDKINKK